MPKPVEWTHSNFENTARVLWTVNPYMPRRFTNIGEIIDFMIDQAQQVDTVIYEGIHMRSIERKDHRFVIASVCPQFVLNYLAKVKENNTKLYNELYEIR